MMFRCCLRRLFDGRLFGVVVAGGGGGAFVAVVVVAFVGLRVVGIGCEMMLLKMSFAGIWLNSP